jgi:hypothetical protein
VACTLRVYLIYFKRGVFLETVDPALNGALPDQPVVWSFLARTSVLADFPKVVLCRDSYNNVAITLRLAVLRWLASEVRFSA